MVMGQPYQNTISSLIKKRSEMMSDGMRLREELAVVGNNIEALDRVLESLGFSGDLTLRMPRGNRVVFFHRNELRRFCLDELRQASAPVTSRELAGKIVRLENKDGRDRRLMHDIVKRVGKSLELLRRQNIVLCEREPIRGYVWKLT